MIALVAGLLPQAAMPQDGNPNNILFILRDKITRFDIPGGLGLQVGTATGKINGASITVFKFDFSAFPAFTVNNRAGITDIDGDQIIFKVVGSGQFGLPLVDPTIPGDTTAPPTQVLGGIGGPVSGTYEVVAASGKYAKAFHLGQKFPFKAVSYNPNPASVGTDPFGTTYVEVYSIPVQ
jgi:hypothetical protein